VTAGLQEENVKDGKKDGEPLYRRTMPNEAGCVSFSLVAAPTEDNRVDLCLR
jgi:hypothetical protein